MPLFLAVLWIATEGGAVDFPTTDRQRWQTAYDLLLGAIASEKVRVIGLAAGRREFVPGYLFAGMKVDHRYEAPSLR